MLTQNWLHWTIAGFLTAYLSMTVEANKLRKEMPSEELYWKMDFGKQYLQNPLIYALIAIIVFFVVTNYFPQNLQQYWIIGAIMGIIIPSMKMINNYAPIVYGVKPSFLFPWDLMVYTIFYGIIIGPLLSRL